MSGEVLHLSVQHVVLVCCHQGCGMTFSVPSWWEDRRRNDHSWWYCPNGHVQHFAGKSEAEQLRDTKAYLERQLKNSQDTVTHYQNKSRRLERSRNVYKGKLKSVKSRVKNGCCPVDGCHRSFAKERALTRHLATVHPDFAGEDKGES